jgi:hypothetical protein
MNHLLGTMSKHLELSRTFARRMRRERLSGHSPKSQLIIEKRRFCFLGP